MNNLRIQQIIERVANHPVTQVTAKVMPMELLKERLDQVHQRMAQAAKAAHRSAAEIRLLAVSKTVSAQRVAQLAECGQTDFGENYIQEGVEKIQALAQSHPHLPLTWHCIGPIQSNKTKLVATHFDWVHSLDRLKIAQRLQEQRPPAQGPLNVCIQVNIDDQASKSGVPAHEVLTLAQQIQALPMLRLRGMMTIPQPTDDPIQQLAVHRQAKQCFDQVGQALAIEGWDTLSMGMTADLECAIQAGSTLVRVGTALFGKRM